MDQLKLPGMPESKSLSELYRSGEISMGEYYRRSYRLSSIQSIENYDPNEIEYRFASYVPNRIQKFKVHKTLAHARSGTSRDVGGVYENVDGAWILLEIRSGTTVLKDCR